jgi:hypothetical protein
MSVKEAEGLLPRIFRLLLSVSIFVGVILKPVTSIIVSVYLVGYTSRVQRRLIELWACRQGRQDLQERKKERI